MQEKILMPNYHNSIIQVVESINKNFNQKFSKTNKILDQIIDQKKYSHVILMLLDGLGSKIIDQTLSEDSFLKKHKLSDLVAIYPSTTACATISTLSGLEPIKTGWIGWENYFREINKNVVLFRNTDYLTGEKLDFNCYDILPYQNFFDQYPFYSDQIFPSYGKNPCRNFNEFLDKVVEFNQKEPKSFLYAYWDEPDYTLHEYGIEHPKVKRLINGMDQKIKDFSEKLTDDTLLIIVADHGHITVNPIYLKEDKELFSYLERMPSNEGRCCTFKVKKDYKQKFIGHFNEKYADYFKLYSKQEFIEAGMLGNYLDGINPRLDDFLGDFVACAISNKFFDYTTEELTLNQFVLKSHHAGLTAEEMLIPLIVYHKERGC